MQFYIYSKRIGINSFTTTAYTSQISDTQAI